MTFQTFLLFLACGLLSFFSAWLNGHSRSSVISVITALTMILGLLAAALIVIISLVLVLPHG